MRSTSLQSRGAATDSSHARERVRQQHFERLAEARQISASLSLRGWFKNDTLPRAHALGYSLLPLRGSARMSFTVLRNLGQSA